MLKNYYYEHMPKNHQIVYHQIREGLKRMDPTFTVRELPMKEMADIFFKMRLENPEIFYASGFSCKKYPQADTVIFKPEYMFEPKKIKEHEKMLKSRIERLVRGTEKMSVLEKEVYIHDFICDHVKYDKLKKSYSHEIIGPLQQGIGVCEGIAKTVKLLCDQMKIECMIAVCDADPENGYKYRHAWNILQYNGKFYHLDATFDNSLGKYGVKRFDYFNLNDKKIFRDHRPLIYPAPACEDGENYYYKTNKLSFTKEEDVKKRVLQAIKKKKDHYVFHWRGGYLTKEKLAELLALIKEAAEEKEQSVAVSVNFAQAVLQVNLLKETKSFEIETEIVEEE